MKARQLLWIPFLLLLLSVTIPVLAAEGDPPTTDEAAEPATSPTPSYTEFLNAVRAKRVRSVIFTGQNIQGTYTNGGDFSLMGPPSDPQLPALLDTYNVQTSYRSETRGDYLNYLPLVIVIGLGIAFFLIARARSGAQQPAENLSRPSGRPSSTVRVIEPGKVPVTFADVAGHDEVKEDLFELVDFLKYPDKYKAMGARIPKGVLLFGPPGTGKTLLARAVAGEAHVPFIHFSASQFVEVYVGVGAARVRDLFAVARKHAPCIIFIDELDAVGRHRGSSMSGNDEREQTLNQLLVEMDGFEMSDGIIVMAATNRPDILDKALLRPGRFDRQITVDVPDLRGRKAILAVHARGKVFKENVNLDLVAQRTPGLTGADLANVLNEAALLAVRARLESIDMTVIDEAIDRVIAGGPAKHGRLITPAEKTRIAVHEAGHALAARFQPNPDPVHRVTIIPRGRAGGYTMTTPDEEQMLYTRSQLMNRLVMLLAGRAAEELLLGEASTGAQNDLERAYDLTRQMVSRFGMSPNIGPVGLPAEPGGFDRGYSEELAALVDREARKLLNDAAERARRLLEAHRAHLERVSQALIERETLDGKELDQILSQDLPASAAAPSVS